MDELFDEEDLFFDGDDELSDNIDVIEREGLRLRKGDNLNIDGYPGKFNPVWIDNQNEIFSINFAGEIVTISFDEITILNKKTVI